ncbi:proteobacterial dedicated sortase system response regulator [Thiolapillus brandeum]|uniref:Two-component system OmpR family response regulator n=1 Tax=Thiolapillus brandeum TaxID=1076588 RepID=A0A7U6GJ74_9GAMM|nr:proteobacterial dedicated sortase system response regulator [Thiolapillus brandeum]BAO44625.1 two-component system OmpR family response regulator [Thiolapillus brandeum]
MPKTIAIVEDEEDIRANYTELFRRQGYEVNGYANRQEALTGISSRLPDLAILDVGLEDEFDGGFELCRELRQRSPTLPIIFLSARDSDIDMVSGLRLGADDYLTKDISLPHLSARVAALFRRVDAMRGGLQENQLFQGDLALDMDRLSAHWKGQPVALTVTELWMLHALAVHPGHVKSREQLMQAANIVVEAATITSHVRRMRARFTELDPDFEQIESVYGIGYRWKESVGG